jgi:uncharacterized protein (DUF952 family)
MADTDIVFKICPRVTWLEANETGTLAPSADDVRDGYVHLSSRAQLPGTLERHFAGRNDLVLLSVETARLPDGALRWEVSRNGQPFPHLYCASSTQFVTRSRELPLGADGRHELPTDAL